MKESSGCLSKGDGGSGNGDGLFSVLRSCMRTKGDFFPLSSTGLFICVTAQRRCERGKEREEFILKQLSARKLCISVLINLIYYPAYSEPVIGEIQSPDEIKKNAFFAHSTFSLSRMKAVLPYESLSSLLCSLIFVIDCLRKIWRDFFCI